MCVCMCTCVCVCVCVYVYVCVLQEEHIVLLVLGSWAAVIYGASKAFGGKKEEAKA